MFFTCMYRARQKNGSQVARIFQARPGRSGKQQQEQNSRNLGTVLLPGTVQCKPELRLRQSGMENSVSLAPKKSMGATDERFE